MGRRRGHGGVRAPTTHRPSLSRRDALEELYRCAGSQFDPEVVEAFARVLGREPRARVA